MALDPAPQTDRRPADGTADPVLFQAVLYPHRSLPRQGFIWLMACVGIVSLVVGGFFLLQGAWPVFGFFGLDLLLLYVCFRANYRRARTYEAVRLTRAALTVVRVDNQRRPQRRQWWSFPPHWLRVDLADPPEPDSPLTLASHGRRLVIGSFLSAEERASFARALRSALMTLRTAG